MANNTINTKTKHNSITFKLFPAQLRPAPGIFRNEPKIINVNHQPAPVQPGN
jgi:hypothetical protein